MNHPIEPFIATYTGGKAYPLGLDPETVRIQDIAHSLSQQCRFAGHTTQFWSVAAHSVEVSRRVQQALVKNIATPEYNPSVARQVILTALLHDASEAYLQDIVRPIKPLVQGYAQWEANVQRAIATRFNLFDPIPDLVHEVDDAIVKDEVANFFPAGSAAWKRYGITTCNEYRTLLPLEPVVAEQRFLERFWELTR